MFNQEAYDTFWHFINERHSIYLKKSSGRPKPWTDDLVLRNWKFCNVFRRLDRTSSYLIRNIIENHLDDPYSLLFNIFLFRAFNLPKTYEVLGGWTEDFKVHEAQMRLRDRVEWNGDTIISGAYMIRGYKGQPKWKSIPETLNLIWNDRELLTEHIMQEGTLQDATEFIVGMKYWGWGPFTSYQVALDLTYSPILPNPPDINTWCEFGPGASRGLKLIFPNIVNNEMLTCSQGLLLESPKHLGSHVPRLSLQDIEFSLCELAKYMRIAAGGRGKHKYDGF